MPLPLMTLEEPDASSRLFFPDDELTYLLLSMDNLRLTWRGIDTFLPLDTARRLRDRLTAHLDAAASARRFLGGDSG